MKIEMLKKMSLTGFFDNGEASNENIMLDGCAYPS